MLGQTSRFNFFYLLFIWLLLAAGCNSKFYDYGFVGNLTSFLNSRYDLKCLVTFASNRKLEIPPEPQQYVRSLERLLAEELNPPLIVWGLGNNAAFWRIISYKAFVIATIEHFSPELEPMFEVLHKTLDKRHDVRILFIIKGLGNVPPSSRQLREFFDWCWRRNFINVAITFQQIKVINGTYSVHNQLFSYTPFPTVTLLNVTRFGYAYEWPALNVSNVQGYVFRVPVYPDMPAAFLVRGRQLRGTTGSLLATYVERINGSLHVEATPHVNRENFHNTTMLAAARGEVDIVVHPYSAMDINAEQTDGVFTYTLTKTCLMVPWQRESPLNRFLRLNFYTNLILFLLLMLMLPLGWQLYARNGYRGLCYAFMIYCLQSLDSIIFRRLPNAYKIVHLSLLMGVFLQRNLRSADLSAAFSVQQLGPQINTVEDFLNSPFRIMLTHTEASMFFAPGLMPTALKQRLLIVNRTTLIKHRESLNTSYAYCCTSEYSRGLDLKQQILRRPIFRCTGPQLCTPYQFRALPIQWNSPFKSSLFRLYLKALRSGLQWNWNIRSYRYIFRVGFKTMLRDTELSFESLCLKDIQVLLHIYFISIGVCVLCFLCELMCKRYMDIKKKKQDSLQKLMGTQINLNIIDK